jgi:transcriptional regulator with XRE-family HTH domain
MMLKVEQLTLRQERLASGLTAAQIAYAAGTSEPNIAAYERGDKNPNPATEERIRRLLRAGATSPIFVNKLMTVPAAAAGVRHGITDGWSTADLLRVVRECLSNSRWVTTEADVAAFFSAPSTTGDRRWDALLAGAVEDLCIRSGRPVPAWTNGHALATFWFVGDNRAFDAYALARSPLSLKIRGVMIDPDSLVSV